MVGSGNLTDAPWPSSGPGAEFLILPGKRVGGLETDTLEDWVSLRTKSFLIIIIIAL